jgi:nucleoside-diphosphate-sugar epimerase
MKDPRLKILIFGGNRFVGKMVASTLALTYDVTVLNRSGTGPPGCRNIIHDRNDPLTIRNDYDLIIDFCLFNPTQAHLLTQFLLRDQPYIFISSAAAYKTSNNVCYNETMETGGLAGFGDYGVHKAKCESLIAEKTINNLIIRPPYIIGDACPRPRLRYYVEGVRIGAPIHVAGDGNKLLTFVWSTDMMNTILDMVCDFDYYVGEGSVYNVVGNEIYTSRSLIQEISTIMGIDPIIKENGPDSPFIDETLILSPRKLGGGFTSIKERLPRFIETCYE